MFATNLNRDLLKRCSNDAKLTKSLAICLMVKRRTSYLKTYKDIAEVTGLSEATIRRYMPLLMQKGFVKRECGTFIFNHLHAPKIYNKKTDSYYRQKHKNILLNDEVADYSSVKNLVTSLRAITIREVQRTRDYFSQVVETAKNPKRGTSLKEIKKAKRILRDCGKENFVDKGMSVRYLHKMLGCGADSLKKVIAYGQNHRLFVRTTYYPIYFYTGKNNGKTYFDYNTDYTEVGIQWQWYTRSGVGLCPSARFSLV